LFAALSAVIPNKPLPFEATDLGTLRIRKHDRAGGVVREYH
jgi:hypothetical protein